MRKREYMETIYTIPITEVFDEVLANPACGCPLCLLKECLEDNELDLILGASMMEPDIRIKTNEQGFCGDHYERMLGMKNRLSLALMLESHLDEVKKHLTASPLAALVGRKTEGAQKKMAKMQTSCYICGKVDFHMSRTVSNLYEMYGRDEEFRKKYRAMPYFCLPHASLLCEQAKKSFSGKSLSAFCEDTMAVTLAYLETLREDVSWFCKKFDYRYENEPWGNAKDAPIRAAAFLTGKNKNNE
ncbi:MAG: hypothetical protein J6S44_00810 [Clostridia bacterium]|nr:hypothetical protein [Clostridia bacterium]